MNQVISKKGFVNNIWANTKIPSLDQYQGGTAVLIAADTDPNIIAQYFDALELIVIPFALSSDGRGFSLAAQLRTLGFTKHLRASGHILVDQFRAALRSGFTDIEISSAQAARNPEQQWLAITHSEGYQTRLLSA